MKTRHLVPLIATLSLFAATPAFAGYGWGAQARGCPAVVAGSVPSAAEAAQLTFMREEEKLARDLYLALYRQWQQPLFNNIAQSEQSHMDQLKCFLDAYGLADPASSEAGRFNDPALQKLYDELSARGLTSLAEALRVGGIVEETDIRDLQGATAQTSLPEIKTLYANLLYGSQRHLRAFASNLAALGERYAAQVLPEGSVTATLNDDPGAIGSAIEIGSGKPLSTQTRFTLRLSGPVAGGEIVLTAQTPFTLSASVAVDPAHQGQAAQWLAVMLHQPPGQRQANAYQLAADGAWQPWNGELRGLRGSPLTLGAQHSFTPYNGSLGTLTGYFQLYCGYLLENGTLVLSATPLAFGVQP